MRGSADVPGMPDVRSRRACYGFEIVCQDQLPEIEFESTTNFSHSEMRAPRGPSFGMRFRHIFSLAFLSSSSVAEFRDPNSGSRNGMYFVTSQHAREIVVPEASNSRAAFLNIRRDSSSEGERCMKDTDHPIRHPLRHPRIFGNVRSRGSCTWRDDQFGRGQNTGLGRSDPTLVHVSVPKVIRGVAPAQLRVDRAECFVRTAFRSRRPQ